MKIPVMPSPRKSQDRQPRYEHRGPKQSVSIGTDVQKEPRIVALPSIQGRSMNVVKTRPPPAEIERARNLCDPRLRATTTA